MATGNFKRQSFTDILAWHDDNYEMWYWEINERVNDINEDLIYFHIKEIDGYYSGVQLDVTLEYGEQYNLLSEEDTQYYFNKTVSEVKDAIKEELNVINQFFDTLVNDTEAVRLKIVGTFSNGEQVYEEVE